MIMKRRCITLIEIIIVMFLIATITGVIAYNYRGSMEEGKAFKTKAGIEKLQTILSLKAAEEEDFQIDTWKTVVSESPLVHNPEALVKDGWGKDFTVTMSDEGEILIHSEKYRDYLRRKGKGSMFGDAAHR